MLEEVPSKAKSILNLYCFLNSELNFIIKDLEQQLQAQEKLKRSHMNKHQETELELDRLKLELTEKDKTLNKTRDKLTQTSTQLDQATTQVKCHASSDCPYNSFSVFLCVSLQPFSKNQGSQTKFLESLPRIKFWEVYASLICIICKSINTCKQLPIFWRALTPPEEIIFILW